MTFLKPTFSNISFKSGSSSLPLLVRGTIRFFILCLNGNNVSKASWRGCLLKAASDDQIKVGSIEVKSSNKDYWNNLAAIYKTDYEAELNPTIVSTGYKTSMRRADEM